MIATRRRYLGVVGGGQLTQQTMVKFLWRAVIGGVEEERTVEVRCDHACAQGVPCPARWQTAARRNSLRAASRKQTNIELIFELALKINNELGFSLFSRLIQKISSILVRFLT